MKLAILTTGSLDDMKGIMNYVHEKALRLTHYDHSLVDAKLFFVITEYVGILRILKYKKQFHSTYYHDSDVIVKGNVEYHILLRKRSLCGALKSLIYRNFIERSFVNKVCGVLSQYDIISSHQLPCHYIAMMMKKLEGIPYVTTWHGSDICITPHKSKILFTYTREVMENASMNFFVSRGLMKMSDSISSNSNKDVIYTGPSDIFFKYSARERQVLRKQYGVDNSKVISYSGNLVPIKNVMVLPEIFKRIADRMNGLDLVFWIIGDGVLEESLKDAIVGTNINYRFFGKVLPSDMPDLMNCTDILVLPSLNEGFSLSVLEARQSGCYVVASRVGGLPESAGVDNCFALDEEFVDNITQRMEDILLNKVPYEPLPKDYSWDAAISKEINCCQSLLKKITYYESK